MAINPVYQLGDLKQCRGCRRITDELRDGLCINCLALDLKLTRLDKERFETEVKLLTAETINLRDQLDRAKNGRARRRWYDRDNNHDLGRDDHD